MKCSLAGNKRGFGWLQVVLSFVILIFLIIAISWAYKGFVAEKVDWSAIKSNAKDTVLIGDSLEGSVNLPSVVKYFLNSASLFIGDVPTALISVVNNPVSAVIIVVLMFIVCLMVLQDIFSEFSMFMGANAKRYLPWTIAFLLTFIIVNVRGLSLITLFMVTFVGGFGEAIAFILAIVFPLLGYFAAHSFLFGPIRELFEKIRKQREDQENKKNANKAGGDVNALLRTAGAVRKSVEDVESDSGPHTADVI